MSPKFFIYVLKNPATNAIVYVGCTCKWIHRRDSLKWIYKRDFGYTPTFEIIETYDCESRAKEKEWQLIKYYNKISPLNQCTDKKMPGKSPSVLSQHRKYCKLRDKLSNEANQDINELLEHE